ncbi:MAG: LytTR family DNA-binding domain-containing protein, partial [Clostridia bacterium]|nr:LytTR family DNA-binding domain-containing protein [Clostridia bacterium]
MLNIAICSGKKSNCSDIEYFINKYALSEHIYIAVDKYCSNTDLILNIKSGEKYDLIFLNQDIDSEDASITGNYIRNELNNQSIGIVYISAHTENIFKLFASRPIDFIQLPVTEEKIFNVFKPFEKIRNNDNMYFKIKNGSDIQLILYKDILYITSKCRKLLVVTNKGKYTCYSKISELENIKGFAMVHKSFLVNLSYIKEYNYKSIELVNGEIIP